MNQENHSRNGKRQTTGANTEMNQMWELSDKDSKTALKKTKPKKNAPTTTYTLKTYK